MPTHMCMNTCTNTLTHTHMDICEHEHGHKGGSKRQKHTLISYKMHAQTKHVVQLMSQTHTDLHICTDTQYLPKDRQDISHIHTHIHTLKCTHRETNTARNPRIETNKTSSINRQSLFFYTL